jgi:hypothetical protein
MAMQQMLMGSYGGGVTVTGGTITTAPDGDRVHTFTGSGTLTITNAPSGGLFAYYLVVGGGGGGGQTSTFSGRTAAGGGGGAGGFRNGSFSLSSGTYTITVGAGGPVNDTGTQSDGNLSSIAGPGLTTTSYTSSGGGVGGAADTSYSINTAGGSGGSGGGGGGQSVGPAGTDGLAINQGTADGFGLGSNGGRGYLKNNNSVAVAYGGGGGGAATTGNNASSSAGGNGGNGNNAVTSGTSTVYCSGGSAAVSTANPAEYGRGGNRTRTGNDGIVIIKYTP